MTISPLNFELRGREAAALSNFDAGAATTSSFYGRSNHPRVKFCQSVNRTDGQPSIRRPSVCPILDRIILPLPVVPDHGAVKQISLSKNFDCVPASLPTLQRLLPTRQP